MLLKVIIGVIILVAAVMIFGFFTKDKNSNAPPSFLKNFVNFKDLDYFADISDLPSCGSNNQLFTQLPINPNDFGSITPLGLLAPTAHVFPTPHLYFNIRTQDPKKYDSLPVETDVLAPADIKITTIRFIEAKNKPDWSDGMVAFGVCREFKAYFDHVKNFSPKVKAAFDNKQLKSCEEYTLGYAPPIGNIDYKLCDAQVSLEVKKGEKIGTAGGGFGQRVFDFGSFDKRTTPAKFAKDERWATRQQLKSAVCGLDYFSDDLKIMLKERLGGQGLSGEVKGVGCGEVVQDIPGTAMGAWVTPDTREIHHDPPHIALVHDNIEPQYLVFSLGDSTSNIGLNAGKYVYLPKEEGTVNRHFKDLKPDGQVFCFDTEEVLYSQGNKLPTAILVTLADAERLMIGKHSSISCGSGPWKLDNFVEFIR